MRAEATSLAKRTRNGVFSALNGRELNRIERAAKQVQVPAGTDVVRENEPGDEFFLILDGQASVNHRGQQVATLGPDEYFGELAIFAEEVRDATVTAATDLRVLILKQPAFAEIVNSTPAFAKKLMRVMAHRLREADSRPAGI